MLIFPLLAFSLQSMRSRLVVLWRVVLCCVVLSRLILSFVAVAQGMKKGRESVRVCVGVPHPNQSVSYRTVWSCRPAAR